jgi:hypothetical protein
MSGNDGFTVCREPSANVDKGEVLLSRGMPRVSSVSAIHSHPDQASVVS